MRGKPRTQVGVAHEEVFVTLRLPLKRRRGRPSAEAVVVMIGMLLVDGRVMRVSAATTQVRGDVKAVPPKTRASARKNSAARRRAK